MRDVVIESVPSSQSQAAIRFLAGGSSRDSLVQMQAESLYQRTLGVNPSVAALWWARRGRIPLAAAMVYRNVGRTGAMLCCPATAPDVDVEWLVRLVHTLSLAEIARGLSLIQALLPPEAKPELTMLGRAGYHRLAQLTYMALAVPRDAGILPASGGEDELSSFRDQPHGTHSAGGTPASRGNARATVTFHQATELPAHELEDVIRRTYEQSQDCPALVGVRDVADVVAGHRASGLFSPESWWIVRVEGQPAACLLLNESFSGEDGDIVYLGVAPEFRRRGLGRAMLQQAISHAQRVSWRRLTLAADSANSPAIKLYEEFQFAVSHRREAWIFTWKDVRQDFP